MSHRAPCCERPVVVSLVLRERDRVWLALAISQPTTMICCSLSVCVSWSTTLHFSLRFAFVLIFAAKEYRENVSLMVYTPLLLLHGNYLPFLHVISPNAVVDSLHWLFGAALSRGRENTREIFKVANEIFFSFFFHLSDDWGSRRKKFSAATV